MDQNTVIVGLAGSITAIIGILVLAIKAWVDGKKGDGKKQCLECTLDHTNIKNQVANIETIVKRIESDREKDRDAFFSRAKDIEDLIRKE